MGIESLTNSYSGEGFPLQRFERVQDAFLIKDVPGKDLSIIEQIFSIAPLYKTLFLVIGLSPAIFPIPQIAYSTTSI